MQTVDPSWQVIGTVDFNGDGKSDILFQNTNGSVTITGRHRRPNLSCKRSIRAGKRSSLSSSYAAMPDARQTPKHPCAAAPIRA